jgi:glycosyltransferase involved in cell wall biosynthesis
MLQTNTTDISRIWVVIPVFNNKDTVVRVARACRLSLPHILVVDDGSTDADIEKAFLGTDITVLRHVRNSGKGTAIRTALQYIREWGAEFMITIDADGQHDPQDISRFIPLLEQDNSAIIVGARDFSSGSIPGRSRFGRDFSNFWLWLETGRDIDDSQSGFRAYPVRYLSRMKLDGRHYDFEIEVLTRAAWSGLELKQVAISVFYPTTESRVSSFRPFLDSLRISLMHARLVGRRLLPLPYPKLLRCANTQPARSMVLHQVKLLRACLRKMLHRRG